MADPVLPSAPSGADEVIERRKLASFPSFGRTVTIATSKRTTADGSTMVAELRLVGPDGRPHTTRLGTGGAHRLVVALCDAIRALEAHEAANPRPSRPARRWRDR